MKAKERDEKLKQLCSDKEFLKKLIEVARLTGLTGWAFDYSEVETFIEECHINGDVPIPDDMKPYDIEYE